MFNFGCLHWSFHSVLLCLVSASRKKRDEKFTVSTNFSSVVCVSPNACQSELRERKSHNSRLTPFPCGAAQRVTPQSPPPPPKPPSPSFELGLSSFPPLPGAAGHLKTDDVFESRLASSVVSGAAKERVNQLRLFSSLFCSSSANKSAEGAIPSVVTWGSIGPVCLLLSVFFFAKGSM